MSGVEISDFEIPCFGSVFRVLVVRRSSYPSLSPLGSQKRLVAAHRGSDTAIRWAAGDGDVPALRHFLRVQPERVHAKDSTGRWPQKTSVELRVLRGGVVVRWVEGA